MDKRKLNIERYLRGEMTPAEMHALEKEALEDPFLSEALEGFQNASPETYLFDLRQLHQSVHQRTKTRKPKIISMWNWSLGIAAGLIFIAVSAVFIISRVAQDKKNSLALAEKATESEIQQDDITTPSDSTLVAGETAPEAPSDEPTVNEGQSVHRDDPGPIASNDLQEEGDEPAEETRAASVDDSISIKRDVSRTQSQTQPTSASPSAEGASKASVSSDTTHLLKGRVTSAEDNTPLPGVNVSLKGTPVATETDANGYFKINVPDIRQSLTFNFIGMEQVEITPVDRSVLNVELNPDLSQLSEVVVIGYGDDDKARRELAEPSGGKDAFEDYLEKSLKYPEQALENGVEGRVTIEFTVGTDGHLAGFQVLKGLGYGCDDEAIRLVREGPAWKPSRRNAQAVPEKVKLRLKFSIPKKK